MPSITIDPYLPPASASEAGLSSAALNRMKPLLPEWKIRSVIIVRRGAIGWEWHDRGTDAMGPLYSCTKSVLSALIGQAIEEGAIRGVHQQMTDFLEGASSASGLGAVTLKHLLTMTPGFDWPDFDKPYEALRKASDPLAFVLERPLSHEPGYAFTYNSGVSHLLSAILTKATGRSALDYAKDKLFLPLGFRRARWTSRGGYNEGGTGLQLYARDLAKFGLLFLRNGEWFGRRLLPQAWVREATRTHHKGLLHYEPPIYGSYGYHWWTSPVAHNGAFECYFAFGHGGQYLVVAPEKDLVIVIRKAATGRNQAILARNLIFERITEALT